MATPVTFDRVKAVNRSLLPSKITSGPLTTILIKSLEIFTV